MFERLTKRDEYGNADIIGVDSAELQINLKFDELNRVTDALNRLAAYEDSGLSPEEVQELAQAKADGRLVILPCKVGDTYSGICREIVPDKKGWKTKEWIETGAVVRFIVTAELTAEKVGYNHQRNIDEVGEVWFVGEGHHEAAEKTLRGE